MTQRYVARLVLDEIEHALDRLIGGLQAQQRHVDEVGHAALGLKRLLDQLKWRAKRKNAFDRIWRRDFDVVVIGAKDVASRGQTAETLRHLCKRFVGLQKFPRGWIDKGDPDRHVGEDLFVENNFTLNPACGFSLPPVKSAAEPGEN